MTAGVPGERPWLIVAAVTPMAPGGGALDLDAIAPMVDFLQRHGADGVLAAGTTGEGILLDAAERRTLAETFRQAVTGRLFVHCGAQTTARTVELAEHAAQIGADGVAVIAPPYYRLDDQALLDHLVAAAQACAPLPFYCYAFAARSGYPLPVEVVRRLRDRVDNLAGVKVSEEPWQAVAPYLEVGVPVLVGNEPLIPAGAEAGTIGTVSGLAAAFPDVVRAVLDEPSPAGAERLRRLRDALGAGGAIIAAAKRVLGMRGVPVNPDVRPPLRALSGPEAATLAAAVRLVTTSPPRAGELYGGGQPRVSVSGDG
jgi:dihydrodipicolinate synthase/N-acetylneuraminate lyase